MPERPLTPWTLLARIEARVAAHRPVNLRWETAVIVMEALRAYVANPRRDLIAAIICTEHNLRREPCRPACRRCLDTAFAIKQIFQGEPDRFGDRRSFEPQPGPAASAEPSKVEERPTRSLAQTNAGEVAARVELPEAPRPDVAGALERGRYP